MTGFFELVLGTDRAGEPSPRRHRGRSQDAARCFARNAYNSEFAPRVAFLDCSEAQRSVSGDRLEFLGRNGTRGRPACLRRARLSGRVGRGARSVPGDAGDASSSPTARSARSSSRSAPGAICADARTLVHRFRGTGPARRRARRRLGLLEPHARRGQRGDAGRLAQLPGQRLAALPGAGVAHVGTQRLLSIGRRVRLSRSAPGRHGAGPRRAGAPARADPACAARQFREGDVQHWWHPPIGPRRAHAHLRRLPVAPVSPSAATSTALGDTGVLDEKVAVPRRPRRQARRGQLLRSPDALGGVGDALRALRARHRARPALRRPRPAADGQRRLERRHEPGRRARQGRERLARVLPVRRARRASRDIARRADDDAFARRCARSRPRRCARTSSDTAWDGGWYRRAYFDDGQPLGSCQQRRVPDRFAAAELVGAVAAPAIPSAPGRRSRRSTRGS